LFQVLVTFHQRCSVQALSMHERHEILLKRNQELRKISSAMQRCVTAQTDHVIRQVPNCQTVSHHFHSCIDRLLQLASTLINVGMSGLVTARLIDICCTQRLIAHIEDELPENHAFIRNLSQCLRSTCGAEKYMLLSLKL
jgi:hypothetical protein